MRVCFDTQIFGVQEYGGISRYFAGIAKEMQGIANVEARVIAPLHINAYLDRLPRELVYGRKVTNYRALSLGRRLAGAVVCDILQRRFDPDVVHKTYYHALPGVPSRAANVITVYDMIQEKFPHDFPPGNLMSKLKRRAVMKADHVICISEQTRLDLLSLYRIPAERVSVTLLGYDSLAEQLGAETEAEFRSRAIGCGSPYLLYVGRRQHGYKNFDGLLRAYQASRWLRATFQVVCFGGGPFREDELARLKDMGILERVRYVGGGDRTLASCYRHAALFVFPSFYEGFGIPPLEAMSVDCPVACSNTSSIPEVVGDAGAYLDPSDIESIRETLERVLGSTSERAELVRRGRIRRREFSWRKCALETVSVYRGITTV